MLQIISQDIHVSKTHRLTLENTEKSIKNGQPRELAIMDLDKERKKKKNKKKPQHNKNIEKIGNHVSQKKNTPGCTHVLAKGKYFLHLIRHPSCYS
jgi:hypothetical protein